MRLSSTSQATYDSRQLFKSIIHIMMVLAIAISVQSASVCDVHTNVVVTSTTKGSYLAYTCSSLPFTTENVAVSVRVSSSTNRFYMMVSSGSYCSSQDAYWPYLSCTNSAGTVTSQSACNRTDYTAADGSTPWCVILYPTSAGSANVRVDIEYWVASYENQWHLNNTGQFGGVAGNDVNATAAWAAGAYGDNVVVQITDTGVQSNHVELSDRFALGLSWHSELNVRDPTPSNMADDHGTGCAGVAAAAINNYCGQGAAPRASIAGYRLFGETYSSSSSAYVRGLYYDEQSSDGRQVSVNSNSWGPFGCSKDGCYFSLMLTPAIASIQYGADHGRNGNGVVYTFAAGNEGYYGGDANMYSYCKLPEVMCIAASDFNGRRVYYSNAGANLFVNAPSQAQSDATKGLWPSIITAQLATGTSNCMDNFGGTSSATPLVAGIVAQILGVRSDLKWRDVQHILMQTADRNDPVSPTWFQNGAGVWFSHHNGFGRVNAGKAVALAKTWSLLGGVTGESSDTISVGQTIPDNSPRTPVSSTITWVANTTNLPDTIEHVMAYVTITHAYPHDLRILLISPAGTVAKLAVPQSTYRATPLTVYPFGARAFWGESPVGTWRINVTDEIAQDEGTFVSWAMSVEGAGVGSVERLATGGYDLSSASLNAGLGMITLVLMLIVSIIMSLF